MKKIIISLVIVLALGGGIIFFRQQRTGALKPETEFKLDALRRGDIKNLVSSTGTLGAVGTVEVGSQISGILEQVLADYNDKVKKGQLLAVVDKTLLESSVRDSQANLAKSQSQLEQAQTEYDRNQTLFQKGLVPELTLLAKKTAVDSAKAGLESAKATLKRAQTNLKYTEIYAPIDGTIIERAVEAGQTISASQNAPTLFTIAEDLSNMEILAAVDESDIGQIKPGMAVRFTVQAYPDEEFTGTVRQIRLKPKTVQDVVNYTVMVDAPNPKGLLLPGMTATLDFVIEERQDVLLVPNTALAFQPSQDLIDKLKQQFQANTAAPQGTPVANQTPENPVATPSGEERPRRPRSQTPDGGNTGQRPPDGQRQRPPEGQTPDGSNFGQRPPNAQDQARSATKMARVFYLDENGNPGMARFLPGATDGAMTEVLQGPQLTEGLKVITGLETTANSASKKTGFQFPIPGLGGGPGPR